MKRILGIVLILIVLAAFTPMCCLADDEYYDLSNGLFDGFVGDGVTILGPGKYRLSDDLEVYFDVIQLTGTVIFDLNGKTYQLWDPNTPCTIKCAENSECSLEIKDGQGGGKFEMNGQIVVDDLTISGGEVTENNNSLSIQAHNITINGGEVTADSITTPNENDSTINISGGTVTGGTLIGCDPYNGKCRVNINGSAVVQDTNQISGITVEIAGNTVLPTNTTRIWASESVTINGGTVTAAHIDGSHGSVTINKGTVTAPISSHNININDGIVKAENCNVHSCLDALYSITISGGEVTATATGEDENYGIMADNIVISKGTVTATGSKDGIHAGSIAISGGTVTASGNDRAIGGTVKNTVPGTGWTNKEGTEGKALIELPSDPESGQGLPSYKNVRFPAPSAVVTFKVVNGAWNDGNTNEIPVTLYCAQGDELILAQNQIPEVNTNLKGSWDTDPSTVTSITPHTTYTYTYNPRAAVTTAPTARDLTYSGKAQALVTAGTASGGTMQYALGKDAETAPSDGWSESIPAGIDAGNYTVWFKAVGDTDNNDSDPAKVTAMIHERSITGAAVTLDKTQLTYNGTQQSVSVTGVTIDGLSLTADDFTVTGNTGTDKGEYKIIVTGKGNFKDTVEAKWSIVEKAMTVNAENVTVPYDGQPHGITVTVTDPAAGAVVTYGKAEGTYDLAASPVITNVSESPLTVYFKVTAANYTDYTGSAVVTITAADDIKSKPIQNELTSVPPELAEFYSDLSELQNALMAKLAVNGEPAQIGQTAFYDVILLISTDGIHWVEATEENFPEGGLWVLLKYPEGTGKNTHDFSVSHMFTVTSERLGTTKGDIEYPDPEKTDEGLNVKLTGLSPVAIAWREINTPGPEPEPERPGLDFFRLYGDCELPATGFSSLRPTDLPEQPKDLRYEPVRMHLMLPTLDRDVELVMMPREGNSWAAAWLGSDAGILEGSALPGEGVSVIAGHNTLNDTDYGPFALLAALDLGDVLFVRRSDGELLRFTVYQNEKIGAGDADALQKSALAYENTLTLLTCEDELPAGGYASRRIVSAKYID